MAQDQTVVDHLLQGRQALHADVDRANTEIEDLQAQIERQHAEVERLTAAIGQLDSVIAMFDAGATVPPARSAPGAREQTPTQSRGVRSNPPPRKATSAPSRPRKPSGQAPKSIRVHVLEMLAAENRDWSLAEIIDRIHDAGIQAHDDAVRSITIKLMKDGRVERVGRGQYRLARRDSSRSTDTSTPPPAAVEDLPVETVAESDPVPATDGDTPDTTEPETVSVEAEPSGADPVQPADTVDGTVDDRPYTPPLNLGQPWS